MYTLNWKELVIQTTEEAKEPIANILNELGANGVVIEEALRADDGYGFRFGKLHDLPEEKFTKKGVTLKAYFLHDDIWPTLQEQIISRIEHLRNLQINIDPFTWSVNHVQETDWENEWKKYFKPFDVTEHFSIVPTWEVSESKEALKQTILMDPGMAFGTGTHVTTKLSLFALENIVNEGDFVVDVGSGSGILSIAACLLGAEHVYSYDLDQVAVNSTINNRDLNQLTNHITVKQNDLLKNIDHDEKVDVVVANILAHIILQLIDDAYKQLKYNGYFIVSGIIEKEVMNIERAIENSGFTIEDTFSEENWYTFIARKRIRR